MCLTDSISDSWFCCTRNARDSGEIGQNLAVNCTYRLVVGCQLPRGCPSLGSRAPITYPDLSPNYRPCPAPSRPPSTSPGRFPISGLSNDRSMPVWRLDRGSLRPGDNLDVSVTKNADCPQFDARLGGQIPMNRSVTLQTTLTWRGESTTSKSSDVTLPTSTPPNQIWGTSHQTLTLAK